MEKEIEELKSNKDIRLEMRIKNNILWKAIHKDCSSVAEFCRKHEKALGKFRQAEIGELLNLKINPKKPDGEYRSVCLLLEGILDLPAEDLFPDHLYQKFVGAETKKIFEIEISSFTGLPSSERKNLLVLESQKYTELNEGMEEVKKRIAEVLETLSSREREIVKLRFGLDDNFIHSLEEVAKIFNVTSARVRQIEAKAIRRLQLPSRTQILLGSYSLLGKR